MADQLGYTERYIGQLERGTKSPIQRTMADIAGAFSTMPSDILRAAEQRRPDSATAPIPRQNLIAQKLNRR